MNDQRLRFILAGEVTVDNNASEQSDSDIINVERKRKRRKQSGSIPRL